MRSSRAVGCEAGVPPAGYDKWRALPPALRPVEPPPIPLELTLLLNRLRLLLCPTGPARDPRASCSRGLGPHAGPDGSLREEAVGRDHATREHHRKSAACRRERRSRPGIVSVSHPALVPNWALRSLDWIGRAENLVLVGPSGTGKSHFAEAIAHAAIDHDLRSPGSPSSRSRHHHPVADRTPRQAMVYRRIVRSDAIVVDDIGLLPAGATRLSASIVWSTRHTSAAH